MASIYDKNNSALSDLGDKIVAALSANEGEPMVILLVAARLSDGSVTSTSNLSEEDCAGMIAMLHEAHQTRGYDVEETKVH